MKKMLALIPLLCLEAVAFHARQYAWGFENGNLVNNWSFEDRSNDWSPGSPFCNSRFNPELAGSGSFSGRFVGNCSLDNSDGGSAVKALSTPVFRVKPNTPYTLSFYILSPVIIGTSSPLVELSATKNLPGNWRPVTGSAYPNAGTWNLQRLVVSTNATEEYARIHLDLVSAGAYGLIHFDDVVFEEGDWTLAEIQVRRKRITEGVQFMDGVGRQQQGQLKIAETPKKYLISGGTFDAVGRPLRSALPYPLQSDALPDFQANPIAAANGFYNGTTAPQADNFAFTEVLYADEPAGRVIANASQGEFWSMDNGRATLSNFCLVETLDIPADIEVCPSSGTKYTRTWSRDVDLHYSASWVDQSGLVVQSAVNHKSDISLPANWAVTRFEYYPGGGLRKTLTPLDVNAGTDHYSEVSNYNNLGQLTGSYSKDLGLIKYWYNRQGSMRFTQNEEQRAMNEYTYTDYDLLGRPISIGTQVLAQMTQDIADKDAEGVVGQNSKVERIGYIYDGLDTFAQRTGVSLSDVLPPTVSILPRANQLFCKYNTNADVPDASYTLKDRLVADFFDYDQKGRTTRQFKYAGAMVGNAKAQRIAYIYDQLNRITSVTQFNSATDNLVSTLHTFTYDAQGRITEIRGKGGEYVARYAYLDRGPLASVRLGGNIQSNTGVRVEYQYHIQGWLKEIKATQLSTGHEVFRQNLGYEDKALADAGVPDLEISQIRLGGQIAQQLYKLTEDVNDPVRLLNYNYDGLGRMIAADYRKNSSSDPLDPLQKYTSPIGLVDAADLDLAMDFDFNGRITRKKAGAVSDQDAAVYSYYPNSYQLNYIEGKLTANGNRSMDPGNFDYDARGDMIEDKSRKMKISYGFNHMPTMFEVESDDRIFCQLQFYDANGMRVSKVTTTKTKPGLPNVFIGAPEQGEAGDLYDYADLHSAQSAVQAALDLLTPSELPAFILFYVVPQAGFDLVSPVPGAITYFTSQGVNISLELRGVKKFSDQYFALVGSKSGQKKLAATHYFNFGKSVNREIVEEYDAQGAVSMAVTHDGLFGSSAKIGRVLPDGSFQFFIKNHLGSTMRTVSADGGYIDKSVYDYSITGELMRLRQNSDVTVTEKWTAKEFDALTKLYYFGARHMDPELGVWLTPDAAGQYSNPYSFAGGDPANQVDLDGNVAVYVNGIGGRRSPDFEIDICAKLGPEYCGARYGDENSAFWAHNFFGNQDRTTQPNQGIQYTVDLSLSAYSSLAFIPGLQAYRGIERAYLNRGNEPVHVVSTSGGSGSAGWGVAFVNLRYGYGSVASHTSYTPGPDWWGRGFATLTGTRNSSYYNAGDWAISHLGAISDLTNPMTYSLDPLQNVNALNMDRWCLEVGHSPALGCRTVNAMLKDEFWGYEWGISKPSDHVFRGFGNGYREHISTNLNPFAVADREWNYWSNFDWSNPGDYGGAAYKYSGAKSVVDVVKDVGCWANPWCD